MCSVAILIINYNTYDKTIECIDSIRNRTTIPYKIYLLDNGSLNDSAEQLEKTYRNSEDVELIFSQENRGYARGNNILLKKAYENGFEYAIVMNNDIICINNAIDILIQTLTSNPKYFMVGPKVFDLGKNVALTAKPKRPCFKEYLAMETLLMRFVPKKSKKDQMNYTELRQVYWLVGAIFAVRMSEFRELDFFDEYTFLYHEEYILSERVLKKGLKMAFLPNAEVLHYHGASLGKGFNFKARCENWRSEQYFFKEYFHWGFIRIYFVFLIRTIETFIFCRKEKGAIKNTLKYIKYGLFDAKKGTTRI